MKKIIRFAINLSLLCSFGYTSAQQQWSLDECIGHATQNSISVREALISQRNGENAVTEAKDRFLPDLSASAGQSFNFGRGLTAENTYAQRNTSNFQWGVSMSLPVFQGLGAVRQLKQSRLSLSALLYQVEEARDNVTLNIISAYLQVLYYKEMRETASQQVALSEYELSRQQTLLDAGRIAEVDVLQAKAQLAQDRQSLVESESSVSQALLDLAQLMQLPSAEGFDIQPVEVAVEPLPELSDVVSHALGSYSTVNRMKKEVEAARASEDVARSGYIPKLSFNAGIGSSYYRISGIENPSFSRQMRDNLNKYLGFSLSIPIFDAFSTRNSLRRAKLQTSLTQLRLEDAKTNIVKAINQAYLQADAAYSKYKAALITEDANKESFAAMQEKYNLGRSNPYEFEQAKTAYLKSRHSAIQARYEYQLRRRIIEFYNR